MAKNRTVLLKKSLGFLFATLLCPMVALGEKVERENLDNFSVQILELTHYFEAYPNFVEQSEEALRFREIARMERALEQELKENPPFGRSGFVGEVRQAPSRGIACNADSWGNCIVENPYQSPYYGTASPGLASRHIAKNRINQLSQERERIQKQQENESGYPTKMRQGPPAGWVFNGQAWCPPGRTDGCLPADEFLGPETQGGGGGPGGSGRGPAQGGETFNSADGYRLEGNLIVYCPPNSGYCLEVRERQPGDQFVDSLSDDETRTYSGIEDRDPRGGSGPDDSAYAPPGSPGSGSGSGPGSAPGTSAGASGYQRLLETFDRCEAGYRRALSICGSSGQEPNRDLVQSQLNLQSATVMSNYVNSVRLASQVRGKGMLEVCEATSQVAKSMTAINGAYTALCLGAQQLCNSSCSQAHQMSQSADPEDLSYALESQPTTFNPTRYHNTCQREMGAHVGQGLFQSAHAAQMLQQAEQCKQQIAMAGPCATPDMWGSEACQAHCQEMEGRASHPACAQFNASVAHCSNPQFAASNSFCLCINHPSDPTCRSSSSPSEIADGRGGSGVPGGGRGDFSSQDPSGSFGGGAQDYGGHAGQVPGGSQTQGSFSGGGGGGGPMGGGGRGGGGAAESPRGGAQASGLKTNIMDGFQGFGGGRRQAAPGRRVAQGDMDSQNPYRRVSVETDDPDFNLKDYLPPEDYRFGGSKKCYRGSDEVGCAFGLSIFEMVSRRYREIAHEMMK